MKTSLVGFVGFKNSGKTFISKSLAVYARMNQYVEDDKVFAIKSLDEHRTVKRIGFSDPLYDMLAVLGITYDEIQDKSIREIPDDRLGGRSIQYALNTIGSDWGRKMMYEDIWMDAAMSRVSPTEMNIFDNVRFRNEADAILSRGGILVSIQNDQVSNDGTYPESFIDELRRDCTMTVFNNANSFVVKTMIGSLYELIFKETT